MERITFCMIISLAIITGCKGQSQKCYNCTDPTGKNCFNSNSTCVGGSCKTVYCKNLLGQKTVEKGCIANVLEEGCRRIENKETGVDCDICICNSPLCNDNLPEQRCFRCPATEDTHYNTFCNSIDFMCHGVGCMMAVCTNQDYYKNNAKEKKRYISKDCLPAKPHSTFTYEYQMLKGVGNMSCTKYQCTGPVCNKNVFAKVTQTHEAYWKSTSTALRPTLTSIGGIIFFVMTMMISSGGIAF